MSWKVFQGSYIIDIFNDFIRDKVLPKMNAWPLPRFVLIMDNARIHYSDVLTRMCEKAGVKFIYLFLYSPDFNPIEQSFAYLKVWMRKNRRWLREYEGDFEGFIEFVINQFNACGDPGAHFKSAGYVRRMGDGIPYLDEYFLGN
jgi:hypothetical protein